MESRLGSKADVHLSARNIGGITEATATFDPGVTILVGENATNRTSLLQSIAAALGTSQYSLKRDADSGTAQLTIQDERYRRTLRREGDEIRTGGDPYLDDPTLAELYAILFESNEIRRTVREEGNIRELIVRPLDLEEINERIGEIVEQRRRIDSDLEEYDRLCDRLKARRATREEYEKRLDELESALETKRAALRATEASAPDESRSSVEVELEEKLDELHDISADLEEVTESLDIERKSLESLREEREALATEFEALEPPEPERLATLDERVEQLRTRKQALDATISELQTVIRFNDERVGADGPDVLPTPEDATISERLDPADQETVCWTCGSVVERSSIEETLAELRRLHQRKRAERSQLAEEIEAVSERRSDLETERERFEHLEARLDDVDEKISSRDATVQRLERRREELQAHERELTAVVEELKASRQSEVLDLQEDVSELEFEIERVREQLSDVDAEIERLEERVAGLESARERREQLTTELRELRSRVEQLEAEAVETFNEHMETVLDVLAYDNIERIWLEATETSVGDGTGSVRERIFDLHVVRRDGEGRVYEDSIQHLSESERELVGLMVALAGYLAHDVHESVPFMLLDSLEMIDGDRLAALADYLSEYVPYLVLVLLPDHASAFAEHESVPDHRITEF